MTIEYAIIGILIVNISALLIRELRRYKRKRNRSSRYGKLNHKISNLDFTLKECMVKNEMLENRIDFVQVHLDRYVKWFEESNITLPIPIKDTTKPSESIDNPIVNKLKPSKKVVKKTPSKKEVTKYAIAKKISYNRAYGRLYYKLNKKQ